MAYKGYIITTNRRIAHVGQCCINLSMIITLIVRVKRVTKRKVICSASFCFSGKHITEVVLIQRRLSEIYRKGDELYLKTTDYKIENTKIILKVFVVTNLHQLELCHQP